jgi:hypothetical protein
VQGVGVCPAALTRGVGVEGHAVAEVTTRSICCCKEEELAIAFMGGELEEAVPTYPLFEGVGRLIFPGTMFSGGEGRTLTGRCATPEKADPNGDPTGEPIRNTDPAGADPNGDWTCSIRGRAGQDGGE